jgi:hypothetical protein
MDKKGKDVEDGKEGHYVEDGQEGRLTFRDIFHENPQVQRQINVQNTYSRYKGPLIAHITDQY